MSLEKENFLRTKFVAHLQQIPADKKPAWGKMNVQQMVEHFSGDALRCASGKLIFKEIILPDGQLEKMRAFMLSEKPFRENTKNPLMTEDPAPMRHQTLQAAIGELQEELITFFQVFEKDSQLITRNPFFGDLNFEENVQLLYKHALHHLKQFGVDPPGR